MKTIILDAKSYIEFCAYYDNLRFKDATAQIETVFLKNKVEITGNEEFLTKMGYE